MPGSPRSTRFPYTTLFRSHHGHHPHHFPRPIVTFYSPPSVVYYTYYTPPPVYYAPPVVYQAAPPVYAPRSEEHTSELQSQSNLVCRLLLEKKHKNLPTKPP